MEEPKPTPPLLTPEERASAIIKAAEEKDGAENAWLCLIEFQRIAKEMQSPFHQNALKAAGYMNRIRAAVEL